jgi:hypothetical protein
VLEGIIFMAITADKLRSIVLADQSLTTQSLLNVFRGQSINVYPSEIYRLAVTANIRLQADETWLALDFEELRSAI